MKTAKRRSSNQALPWLMAFAIITWIPSMTMAHSGAQYSNQAGIYTVQPGESLWSIAARFVTHDGDVDTLVDRIVAMNGLAKTPLHPGQELRIPHYVQAAE